MNLITAHSTLPKSIFLAGPTPRSLDVTAWRPKAIDILTNLEKELGEVELTIYTPTTQTGYLSGDPDQQVAWEWEAMAIATVIAFWIPRDLETLPGFTTNVEYGMEIMRDKIVVGMPPNAPKNKYLDKLAARFHIPVHNTLEETMYASLAKLILPYG